MKAMLSSILCSLGLIWTVAAMAQAPGREDVTLVSVTETVEAINYETREVVLRQEDGKLKQVIVGDNVKRLDDVRVGDEVTVDFFVSNLYEVREPTAEELQQPFVELNHEVQAQAEALPAGASLKQFRSVCTIVDLNSVNMTGTLQDSRGKYFVVAIKNPDNITKLRIGQTVVVTHTEALAISLEKPETVKTLVKPTSL